jgi:hypothetical protein
MLTQAELKGFLHYDPELGKFYWKVHRQPQSPIGSVAGWNNGQNAFRIQLKGKSYLVHRLAWFYMNGVWPDQIDHRNGDRSDNRFCNLREANNSQNQANMCAKSNSGTGYRGISLLKNSYVVQLYKTSCGQKRKITKYFVDLEEAKIFAEKHSKLLHGEYSFFNRS